MSLDQILDHHLAIAWMLFLHCLLEIIDFYVTVDQFLLLYCSCIEFLCYS